jgi:hypothetical protein
MDHIREIILTYVYTRKVPDVVWNQVHHTHGLLESGWVTMQGEIFFRFNLIKSIKVQINIEAARHNADSCFI